MIETFGGKLGKIELQKYMFLYIQEFSYKRHYAFVPYRYGSFSYELYKDLHTLERNGFLQIGAKEVELTSSGMLEHIDKKEQKELWRFHHIYKEITGDPLIGLVYRKYPYYAIKSEIKNKFLTKEQQQKPMLIATFEGLYTIGYEGKKFEEYLNQLIQNDVAVLVDVRKNAHSMKYGFSKRTLQKAVENLGIKYIHMPLLGIESENRKELTSKSDYERLFQAYAKTLDDKQSELYRLYRIITQTKRAAITCFEKDVAYCHRGVIARKLQSDFGVEIRHI